MDKQENLLGIYISRVSESENPGLELAKFYCELNSFTINSKHIAMFNKLLKEFNRQDILTAISDVFSNDTVDHAKIYGLFKYICRQKLSNREERKPRSLSDQANSRSMQLLKSQNTKLKIRSPFNEI